MQHGNETLQPLGTRLRVTSRECAAYPLTSALLALHSLGAIILAVGIYQPVPGRNTVLRPHMLQQTFDDGEGLLLGSSWLLTASGGRTPLPFPMASGGGCFDAAMDAPISILRQAW